MALIVVGLTKDPDAALQLVRVLDCAGFSGEDLDARHALGTQLAARGVPQREADAYEARVNGGSGLVCVHADDEAEGAEAVDIIEEHGAAARGYPFCRRGTTCDS